MGNRGRKGAGKIIRHVQIINESIETHTARLSRDVACDGVQHAELIEALQCKLTATICTVYSESLCTTARKGIQSEH
jgi:hypothetical protein